MASGAGLMATSGVLWGAHLSSAKHSPPVLRPPGALPDVQFLAKCIKCGLCVVDCPYDALILSVPGDGLAVGTPYLLPRQRPCYMCTDIPCASSCPTGALDLRLLTREGESQPDITLTRMGLAHIDHETCIAYWGMQCDVCYRACPLIDKALIIQATRNDRTGKHAFLAPVVDSEHCTGCGICQHVCITPKASINILPMGVAKGSSDARYMRGWKQQSPNDLASESTNDTTTKTPRSSASPTDYLNREL